jgi:hypothetical protein
LVQEEEANQCPMGQIELMILRRKKEVYYASQKKASGCCDSQCDAPIKHSEPLNLLKNTENKTNISLLAYTPFDTPRCTPLLLRAG